MSRRYAIPAQRRVRPLGEGQRRCACVTVGRRAALFAWVGCTSCHGTGIDCAPLSLAPRGARYCNGSSLREGL